MSEITKEMFQAYEEVRKRGRFNMFDPRARELTGLSREDYLNIISNYNTYMEKWPDVRKR
jgi:PAS domain-containing protein